MFKNVLFPIDQSREAIATASKAVQLALSQKSHLIVLSVLENNVSTSQQAEARNSLIKKAYELIEEAGVSVELIEREGKAAFVICDIADDLDVDLIIMGTKGVNLENNAESTAARVIQLAPCPVLVVP